MREAIKKIIPKTSFLYKIVSKIYNYKTNQLSWLPEERSIEKILLKYSQNKKDIQFIQIGSNDGVSGDPIVDLVKKNDWHGILVEPVPFLFEKLKKNYEKQKENLFFENSAISKNDGKAKFYRLKQCDGPETPNWFNQLGSFNKDVVVSHKADIPNFDELFLEEDIPTLSFSSLLKKYNFYKVNLIHIDTEGYDFEIIKLIDFKTISPDILIYEHKHLHPVDHKRSVNLLKKCGHKLFIDGRDTIALKNGLDLAS